MLHNVIEFHDHSLSRTLHVCYFEDFSLPPPSGPLALKSHAMKIEKVFRRLSEWKRA